MMETDSRLVTERREREVILMFCYIYVQAWRRKGGKALSQFFGELKAMCSSENR